MSKKDKKAKDALSRLDTPFGPDLSFAASEAYRLLRTNLMFALPDERKCRIIGITSSLAGEGKSTTALNLAYMLAEADKKVLLIESDMRLPTISRRLGVEPKPGLSNMLAGMSGGSNVIKPSGVEENLTIVPAGDIPPNPSELLGSEQMKAALDVFSEINDFIIMDLPPITEVSDALVASRLVDGMIMVVRQGYSNRRSLAEAMRQLELSGTKILGFVMTGASTQNKFGYKKSYGYYKYGKYRKSYRHGYYSYAKSYADAAKAAEENRSEKKK